MLSGVLEFSSYLAAALGRGSTAHRELARGYTISDVRGDTLEFSPGHKGHGVSHSPLAYHHLALVCVDPGPGTWSHSWPELADGLQVLDVLQNEKNDRPLLTV